METARRMQAVRRRLHLSQAQFGHIFTSQRKEGKPLEGRAVSHWENGKSAPTHGQLLQLLEFLDDPTKWLVAQLGSQPSSRVAMNYLRWYDPEFDGLSYQALSPILQPRLVRGRKQSLEPLVLDILNQTEPQTDWDRRLLRCSRFSSKAPLQEIGFLRDFEGSQVAVGRKEPVLADLATHGEALAGLFDPELWFSGRGRPDMVKARQAHEQLEATVIDIFGRLLGGVGFPRDLIVEWFSKASEQEKFACNLGVLITLLRFAIPLANSEEGKRARAVFQSSATWHNHLVSMQRYRQLNREVSEGAFERLLRGELSFEDFASDLMLRLGSALDTIDREAPPVNPQDRCQRDTFLDDVAQNLASTLKADGVKRIVLMGEFDAPQA